MARITSGVAARASKKDEDFFARGDGIFGVFDGHGGAGLSKALATELPMRLKSAEDDIVGTYYAVDADLGAQYPTQGSTASVVKVDRNEVVLSWVGDSKILEVCLMTKKLMYETPIHHVTNPSEIARIDVQSRSRKRKTLKKVAKEANYDPAEIRQSEVFTGTIDAILMQEPQSPGVIWTKSTKHLQAAVRAQSRAKVIDTLSRAFEYEHRVEAAFGEQSDDDDFTEEEEKTQQRRMKRQQTTISHRRRQGSIGPVVVQTNWKEKSVIHNGASTSVTRSIGDWDSSRTLVPHPDVEVRKLGGVAWRRYVIATDGLWDVITSKAAKDVVLHLDHPQDAADALLRFAQRKYTKAAANNPAFQNMNVFKDDTTVVVVDVQLGDAVLPTSSSFGFFCAPSFFASSSRNKKQTLPQTKRTTSAPPASTDDITDVSDLARHSVP